MFNTWYLLGTGVMLLMIGLFFGTNVGVSMSLAYGPEYACQNMRLVVLKCEPMVR